MQKKQATTPGQVPLSHESQLIKISQGSNSMEEVAAIDWNQVIGKEARGARNDGDFGEMQEAGRHYVVTQRGILEKEKFYIPKYLVYGFDGHTLWFNITEDQLGQFKRDLPPAYEYASYRSQSAPADIEDRVQRVDRRQKDAAL